MDHSLRLDKGEYQVRYTPTDLDLLLEDTLPLISVIAEVKYTSDELDYLYLIIYT